MIDNKMTIEAGILPLARTTEIVRNNFYDEDVDFGFHNQRTYYLTKNAKIVANYLLGIGLVEPTKEE